MTREQALALVAAGLPLSAAELALVLREGISNFHKKAKRGTYDAFLLTPALGQKRYSGEKVRRYLAGDPVYVPTFGRKRA